VALLQPYRGAKFSIRLIPDYSLMLHKYYGDWEEFSEACYCRGVIPVLIGGGIGGAFCCRTHYAKRGHFGGNNVEQQLLPLILTGLQRSLGSEQESLPGVVGGQRYT
jgi:hypothetical protein